MRKIIVQEFLTLDGFAAGVNNETDFMPQSTSGSPENNFENNQWDFMDTVDTMVLGRNTHQLFSNYWPTAKDEIAGKLNSLSRIVFSQTLKHAPWGKLSSATIISKPAEAELVRLKQLTGKNIVIWGSLSLVKSLMHTKLIDTYELIVCPTALGKGKRLFPEDKGITHFELLETKSFNGGCVMLRYQTGK